MKVCSKIIMPLILKICQFYQNFIFDPLTNQNSVNNKLNNNNYVIMAKRIHQCLSTASFDVPISSHAYDLNGNHVGIKRNSYILSVTFPKLEYFHMLQSISSVSIQLLLGFAYFRKTNKNLYFANKYLTKAWFVYSHRN
jgi:hypothetical protein